MTLTELDKELLDLLALEVPWPMVCFDFHARFGSVAALARRLCELEQAGLVVLESSTPGESRISAAALEADASRNANYDGFTHLKEHPWAMAVTESGFDAIAARLGKE